MEEDYRATQLLLLQQLTAEQRTGTRSTATHAEHLGDEWFLEKRRDHGETVRLYSHRLRLEDQESTTEGCRRREGRGDERSGVA